MKGKDNNNRTSLPDLLKYIANKMSGKERNSFERELQKDPFANEAAEGFSEIPADQAGKDIDLMKKKLEKRVSGRRIMIWYRIAASVAVLMIISSLFIVIEKSNWSKQLNKEVALSTLQNENLPKSITPPQISEAKGEVKKENLSETPPSGQNRSDTKAAGKTIPGKDNTKAWKYISVQPLEDTNEISMPSPPSDTIEVFAADQTIKVMEEVQEENEKTRELPTNPSEPALSEAAALQYKMVKADKAAGANMNASVLTTPQPSCGKENFDKYIEENIKNPVFLPAGKTDSVVISFTVTRTGSIRNIKILFTPGEEFSKEAERLLKNGPAWLPAEKNGVRISEEVSIKIVFK